MEGNTPGEDRAGAVRSRDNYCVANTGTGLVLRDLCAPTATDVRAVPSEPSFAGMTGTVSGDRLSNLKHSSVLLFL